MKIRLLHGTTGDNIESIHKHGLDPSRGKPNWYCSGDPNYFWRPIKFDGETYKEKFSLAFEYACDSAFFGIAIARDCRRLILEVEVEKDLLKEDNSGGKTIREAVRCDRVIPVENIKRAWIDENDLSLLRIYSAALRFKNHLAIPMDLNVLEQEILKCLRLECFCDVLHDYETPESFLEFDIKSETECQRAIADRKVRW